MLDLHDILELSGYHEAMQRTILILSLLALLYCLMFHNLGTRELWSSHEARAAQDAQSLLETGDWRLPHLFDGRAELQKPPLYYWLTAAIGWLQGGINEVTVRLPAVLGSLLTGLALLLQLRRAGNARAGWLAMLAVWTMIHFTWMSRVGRIDMPLTAAVTWCLVSFWNGMTGGSRGWYLLGYLCLLAGVMLKGPIAGVLVGVVWTVLWGANFYVRRHHTECDDYKPEWKSFWLSALVGIPAVIVIVLAWSWWMNDFTKGKFVEEFVIKHNLQRGLGGDEQLDGHVHPWWFYLARFWLDTAPWGLLLPVAAWAVVRRKLTSPLASLGVIWFGSILLIMSAMQYKRADYLLPAYPGLALLIGIYIDAVLRQLSLPRILQAYRLGLAAAVCIALGWFSYVQWIMPMWEPQRAMRPFAHLVRSYLPAPGQVILFRIDSHQLAWELGKRVDRIWEWENLSWWATRPAPVFVVMPENYANEVKDQLQSGELIRLSSNTELNHGKHDVPLVLFVNGYGRALARR